MIINNISSIPQKLIKRLSLIYTKDQLDIVLSWFKNKTISTFRANSHKTNSKEIWQILDSAWIKYFHHDLMPGFFCIERSDYKLVTDLSIYNEWHIYFQSLSSAIPVTLFSNLDSNSRILDACAAPWSKTWELSEILWNKWKIISVEKYWVRFEKLKHTIKLLDLRNVDLIKADVLDTDKYTETYKNFTHILVDSPCSSEWQIQENRKKSYEYWSEENIFKKAKLQKSLLNAVIPLLSEWWELIYSTCTMAPEENEWVVNWVLRHHKDLELEDLTTRLKNKLIIPWIDHFRDKYFSKKVTNTIRALPSLETEWFFIAKFVKKTLKTK